jgi:hypothetical protein
MNLQTASEPTLGSPRHIQNPRAEMGARPHEPICTRVTARSRGDRLLTWAVVVLLTGLAVSGLLSVTDNGKLIGNFLISSSEAGAPSNAVLRGGTWDAAARPNLDVVAARVAEIPLTEADVMALQARLHKLGFEPGEIDGVPGGRTLDALNRYRESELLPRAASVNYISAQQLLD